MKLASIYILSFTIALTSSNNEAANSREAKLFESESMHLSGTTHSRLDTLPDEPENLTCNNSKKGYRNDMGLGIMSLAIHPGESISLSYSSSNAEGKKIVIHLSEYWKLVSDRKEETDFDPFKYATNFENFGFLWVSTDSTNASEEIMLSQNDHTYWLHPEEKEKCVLIPWEKYLKGAIVKVNVENPIYIQPDEGTEITGYPEGAYYIFDVQNRWIKIAHIDKHDLTQNHDSMITAGWVKWYCDNEIRICILDDTDMENYYLE